MSVASPRRSRQWRFCGLLAVTFFLVLVGRHWRPVYRFTDLIQLDAGNDDLKITAFREHPIYVYRNTGGYDGLYYAQIAYDPLLANPELSRAIDSPTYRARRILPSAMSWLLAAGQPSAIVHIYSIFNIAVWLVLAALLWRTLPVHDVRSFLGWSGVLFSAGALASVRFGLTDLTATTLMAASIFAVGNRQKSSAPLWLAAAALTRETSLAAVVAIADPPWISWRNLRRTIVATLPLIGWIFFVRWRLGSSEGGFSNLTWPLVSYVQKWTENIAAFSTEGDWWPVATGLLALVGITAQAIYIFSLPLWSERWWRLGAIFVVMAVFLSRAVWEGFPGAFTRVLLPLTLAFNVLASRRRDSLAWLFLGNLTIFAGIGALGEVHRDPRELAEVRNRGIPLVATLGRGWFGMEHTRRHTWSWCDGTGEISLESWPKDKLQATIDFSLRAVSPRQIHAWQNGREIWHGAAGVTRGGTEQLPVEILQGRATIIFTADRPPQREGSGADARDLSFAVYDAHLHVSPP